MIVDGRAIAEELLIETRMRVDAHALTPRFAAITVAPSAATESYLRIKHRLAERAGISMEVVAMDEASTTEDLINVIQRDTHDAVIVQLPLPSHIDTEAVLAALPTEKDADVLSPAARTNGLLIHPIPQAIQAILEKTGVSVSGKRAVVIGKGWLVGEPVREWLTAQGAEVTAISRESGDLSACLEADIVVAGAGVPGLVTPEVIQEGAVVLDVGTSELGGSIRGDVAPEVSEKASVFTPVPGGVGPVAVACLMRNVVELAKQRRLQEPGNAV